MELADVLLAFGSLFIGTIISLYVTVVFARTERFGALLRELARERQHYEGYPSTPNDVGRAGYKATEFWRTAERIEWALNADGHYSAGGQVGRVRQWAYWVASNVERLGDSELSREQHSLTFQAFQSKYQRTIDRFIQFEKTLCSSKLALFQPWPHSVMPNKSVTVLEDFDAESGPVVRPPGGHKLDLNVDAQSEQTK